MHLFDYLLLRQITAESIRERIFELTELLPRVWCLHFWNTALIDEREYCKFIAGGGAHNKSHCVLGMNIGQHPDTMPSIDQI